MFKVITNLQDLLEKVELEYVASDELDQETLESLEYERAILDGYHMLISDVDVNQETEDYILEHCNDVTELYYSSDDALNRFI